MPVAVKILREGRAKEFPLPEYATESAAGADLRSAEDMLLLPGERTSVGTGIRIELPEGYEAQVRPRSGLAIRHGVTILNAPGTIDSLIATGAGNDIRLIRKAIAEARKRGY